MSDEARHLTVLGELAGEYIVDEELADGRLVIRLETSAAAMNRRMGVEPISADEFNAFLAEHGEQMLPADDEG